MGENPSAARGGGGAMTSRFRSLLLASALGAAAAGVQAQEGSAAPAAARTTRPKEPVAAIDEAYRCLAKTKEEGIAACRSALTLGPAPWRAEVIRQALAVKLTNLERLQEAVEVYRESARLWPKDAAAQLRFGSALLYFAADAAGSEAPLREALRLDPQSATAQATLAMALLTSGRFSEARSAFDEAVRLDPSYFEGRPGARQAYEAAQRGEGWP